MKWNQFTLGTLLFGVFVVSILMAINARFALASPIIRQDKMYGYSCGWPVPLQSGPAPTPVVVHTDGSEEQGASGYNAFNPLARFVNVLIAVVVVVLSYFGFNWIRFHRNMICAANIESSAVSLRDRLRFLLDVRSVSKIKRASTSSASLTAATDILPVGRTK